VRRLLSYQALFTLSRTF